MDCIADNTKKECVQCGWLKPEKIVGWPHRNCSNPPNIRPAADRLGLPDPIPPGMAQYLGVWLAAGMPERTEEERAAIAGNGCESRRADGCCNALGCANGTKIIRCEWLAGMATGNCPKGLFGDGRRAVKEEIAQASVL